MREPVPNQRQYPSTRKSGALPLAIATFFLLTLSCGSSLLLDQSHVDEVTALIDDGWFAKAEVRAAELLDDSRPGEGTSALARAEVMGLLASTLRRSNTHKRPEAQALARQALELKIELVGDKHPSVADSLFDLSFSYAATGEERKARLACERALEIRKTALGPDHPSVALSLIQLAILHWSSADDTERTMDLLDEARRIQDKTLPGTHRDVAHRIFSAGLVNHWLRNVGAARSCYERALAIREQALRPEHPDTASCHEHLGMILEMQGDYPAARRQLDKSLAMDMVNVGPDHYFIAFSLISLAELLSNMGDCEAAEQYYRRALVIREAHYGPDDPQTIETAWLLADFLESIGGNDEEARELFQRVLEHTGEDDLFSIRVKVEVLNQYSRVLQALGEEEAAKRSMARGLVLARGELGDDDRGTRWAMMNQAAQYARQGNFAEADRMFRMGLDKYELIPGSDLLDQLFGLKNHARTLSQLGRTGEALASALRAETLAREHFQLTARSLETDLALKFAALMADSLHSAVSVVTDIEEEDPELPMNKVADAIVRGRALVFDELAARARAVRDTDDPRVAALRGELRDARNDLADRVVSGSPDSELDRARQRKSNAERALAETSESFRREQVECRISITDVRKAIPPGSSLVSFLRFIDSELAESGKGLVWSPCYLALVLTGPEAPVRLLKLGQAEEVDRLVLDWRNELLKGTAADIPGLDIDTSYRLAGDALRQQIWDPLLPYLGNCRRVFLVPDSTLHLVSFASLPVGEEEYLLEQGPAIHYLSTEREIAHWAAQIPDDDFRTSSMLLVGDPAFGLHESDRRNEDSPDTGSPDDLLLRYADLDFTPLPGTAEELERVAEIWQTRQSMEIASSSALTTLNRDQATESAFKEEAPQCRFLHLATHAYFLNPENAKSRQPGSFQRLQTGQRSFHLSRPDDNPLLRAGLALAGANNRNSGGEDGILTAEEIVSLDLRAVHLAVLSACDTGLGTVQSGEGIFGLRRAFHLAGVDTVITSLWPVEDQSAIQWMYSFYTAQLVQEVGISEAARLASLGILNQRRTAGSSCHPFFWAAFAATGDWR